MSAKVYSIPKPGRGLNGDNLNIRGGRAVTNLTLSATASTPGPTSLGEPGPSLCSSSSLTGTGWSSLHTPAELLPVMGREGSSVRVELHVLSCQALTCAKPCCNITGTSFTWRLLVLLALGHAGSVQDSLIPARYREQVAEAAKADFRLPGAESFKSLGLFGDRVHRFKFMPTADVRSRQGRGEQALRRRQEPAGLGSGRLVLWGSFCGCWF